MLTQPWSDKDQKNIIEQGFTLVELLIVIVILGILAGVVIFAIGNLQNSAQGKSCVTEAQTVKTAIAAWKAANPTLTIGANTTGPVTQTGFTVMADLTQAANPNGHTAVIANTSPTGTGLLQTTPKDYSSAGTSYWDNSGTNGQGGIAAGTGTGQWGNAQTQAWRLNLSSPTMVEQSQGCQ